MQPLVERPDPHPDSRPVGTDMSRNLKLEVHHGRALVALSGNKTHGPTGPMLVVQVQVGRPHSLLPDAHFQPEAIATSIRGLITSTSESATSMKGRSRPKELSPNISKTLHDTTHSNKQITKPPWNCFEISMKKFKLSTGAMVLPCTRLVSQLGGEGVPEGNMYHAFAYSPFHHLALHC